MTIFCSRSLLVNDWIIYQEYGPSAS